MVKYPNDRLVYKAVNHVILGIDPPRLHCIPPERGGTKKRRLDFHLQTGPFLAIIRNG